MDPLRIWEKDMETKRHIRNTTLKLRDNLTQEERKAKSKMIQEKIISAAVYKEAEIILSYMNYKSEVETEELVLKALKEGKKVYCPKVNGDTMEFYRVSSIEDTEIGCMGIREPFAEEAKLLRESDISIGKCLMIMPGSAFDKDRNRIGYGKGYYDKYLNQYSGLSTIAICYDCQIVDKVPKEEYDIKPDAVISESYEYGVIG